MYPRYLMQSRSERGEPWNMRYLSLPEAGALYDSGWCEVMIGSTVLLDDKGHVREVTDADRRAISNAADDYSDSK